MEPKLNIFELIEMHVKTIKSQRYNSLPCHLPKHIYNNNGQDICARQIIDEYLWTRTGEGREPYKTYLRKCKTDYLQKILQEQTNITSLTTLVIIAILMERKVLKVGAK